MRREPLSEHTLRRFRDEADRYARNNFEGRESLSGRGIAWDDANAAWERMRGHSAELDDRIGGHWRRQYRATCAELGAEG